MRARARLQLREQVSNVRLHRLFAEEEAVTDLAIHEPIRDELQDLDLPHRRLLLQLAERAVEGDDLGASVLALGSNRLETALVVHVPAQDLLALCGVHARAIGRLAKPL